MTQLPATSPAPTYVGKQCLIQFTIPFFVAGVDPSGGPNIIQHDKGVVQVPAFVMRIDAEEGDFYHASYVPAGDPAVRCHVRVNKGAVAFITMVDKSLVSLAGAGFLAPTGTR